MTDTTDDETTTAETDEPEGAGSEGAVDHPDVLERQFRDHKKYVCGICEANCFHTLDDPGPVVEHIERQH